MKTDESVQQLYNKAEEELHKAKQELMRPSADVVNFAVCANARSALYHYLVSLYTIHSRDRNETPKENLNLKQLIEECRRYDDRIQNKDFTCVKCQERNVLSDEEIFFCDDVSQVQACTNMAEEVRALINEKIGQI